MAAKVGERQSALRSLAAAVAGLCGLTAASAAVAWDAAIGTHPERLGPLGSISLSAALGAVALGMTVLITGDRNPRRVAITAAGASLGLLTLVYWLWVIQGILDTT